MFYKLLVISILTATVTACNNEPAPTDPKVEQDSTTIPRDSAEVAQPRPPRSGGECFAKMSANDTVILRYSTKDTIVEGTLMYNYNEKDKNEGTLVGVVHGDTLIADYHFISEGINSVRQVIFLKRNNSIIEGFGDVVDDHGRMVFENTAKLTFDETMLLKPIDCNQLPSIKK